MRTALWAVAAVVISGCGAATPAPRDVRVTLPAADSQWIDFVTSEQTIAAGDEKMWCSELVYDGEETAFNYVESLQGKFGHHVVLVSSRAPRGAGSVYDCTDMTDFLPLAIPTDEWATGYGSILKKGTPIVIQMHYVNTGKDPILVRDVVRLRKMAPSAVTTWVAPYTFFTDTFNVPAGGTASKTFDCVLPANQKLMMVGGHMHEWGATFKVETGASTSALTTLYEVPTWQASYRDNPPVDLYLTNHKEMAQGTVFRTTCSWNNDTTDALKSPKEMCVLFGLVAGTQQALSCHDGTF